jgi:hypothetical protein
MKDVSGVVPTAVFKWLVVILIDSSFNVTFYFSSLLILVKGKAIPVTGREGPQGCETSKLPYFL